jgi:membrane protein required for colicin V production
MNTLDWIIAVVFMVFVALGFRRGFLKEVLSLVSWLVSAVVAWLFASDVAPFFSVWLHEPAARIGAGFVATFVLVFLVTTTAGILLRRWLLVRPWTRFVNYLLGGVTGAGRGILVLVLLTLVAGTTSAPRQPWWRQSLFMPTLQEVALEIGGYLPRDVLRYISYN